MRTVLTCAAAAILLCSGLTAASAQGTDSIATADPKVPERKAVFAIVDATVISTAEYDAAFGAAQRGRYYHRKVPDSQLDPLRREVGDELIDRALLAAEAQRRNVEPDREGVNNQIAEYERRYGSSPSWSKMKAEALPALVAELERRSRLARLETQMRSVPAPSEAELLDFYRQRPASFTEPERIRLSVILLRVDPSAPRTAWEQAQQEAAAIRARIIGGADFGDLARLHSADATAPVGGDMGYLHRGMLPQALQEAVDKLAAGEVSEPLPTLEGVAVLRVADRKLARLREFEMVRDRARELWQREAGERAWRSFLGDLRRRARIEIVDAGRYPTLPPSRDERGETPTSAAPAPQASR